MTHEGQRGLWTLRCCLSPNLCPRLDLWGAKRQVHLGTSLYHGDENVGLFLEAEDTAMLCFHWLRRGRVSTFPLSPVGGRKWGVGGGYHGQKEQLHLSLGGCAWLQGMADLGF